MSVFLVAGFAWLGLAVARLVVVRHGRPRLTAIAAGATAACS